MNIKEEQPTSIFEAVRYWSEQSPNKEVFIFLKEGYSIEQRLSYIELYHSVRRIATTISNKLKKNQTPVLMLFPTGLDFIKSFLALQASRNIAIPVFPPRNSKHLDRFQSIINDSEAKRY